MIDTKAVAAIVVTFNRRALLEKCLVALATQSHPLHSLLVVDNASTDGTAAWLDAWLPREAPYANIISLKQNLGGAGGFAEGISKAMNTGAEWFWIMDDDAEPLPDALAELMKVAINPNDVYGSVAICNQATSWAVTLIEDSPHIVSDLEEIPNLAQVESLPFLGFLIHRDLVARIGLPDASFFIAADDVEYCVRAKSANAKVFVAGKSRIQHPKADRYAIRFLGKEFQCLKLPPWKRYYDTRNRLLIGRRYYGSRYLTQTIPSSLVRLGATLLCEPRKLTQLQAFLAGFIDGVLGIKGRRHSWWRISQ